MDDDKDKGGTEERQASAITRGSKSRGDSKESGGSRREICE